MRSTTTNKTGTRKIPRIVAADIPVITELPKTLRPMAPAPLAVHSGTHPKNEGEGGH